MNVQRILLVSIVFLTGTAGLASAQVAAPSLLPNEYTTPNPAIIQWGAPSRVGGGYGEQEVTDDPSTGDLTHTQSIVGFRGVWESFALAGQVAQFETKSGPVDESVEQSTIEGSLRITDWLSIGALNQRLDFSQRQVDGSKFTADSTIMAYGVSLKLAEIFFLGYAQGTDEVDVEFTTGPPTPITFSGSDTREVRLFGAGIRAGSEMRLHAEVYQIEFDPIEIPALSLKAEEVSESVAVLEVAWGNLVAGVTLTQTENKSDDEDTEKAAYALGWAPMSGLAFIYEIEESETTDSTDAVVKKTRAQGLSVVWQF